MYFLGIDVGTSGCKTLVTDEKGHVVSSAYRQYGVLTPQPGWLELDAEMVCRKVFECIGECAAKGIGSKIAAAAVSTQGEAIVPVSAEGKPLHNAIVTFDVRSAEDNEWFAGLVDQNHITQITGAPIHPMFSLSKILWLKRCRSEIYNKAHKMLCFGDFISMRLGAAPCIDYTMAARTLMFDIHKKQWDDGILSLCGISKDMLPDAVPSGAVIGNVSAGIADELGLNPMMSIAAGAHDQICCALGAGVTEGGIAMDSLGTTETILCVNQGVVITPDMAANNMPVYPYAIDGYYACCTFLSCCGSILAWFKDSLLKDGRSFAELDGQCDSLPSPVMVLPHFAGSGTPYLDFQSRGAIVGLTLGTTATDIYKAVIESTCFEMMINLSLMEKSGIAVNQLRSIGGGAKSPFWMQLKADISGKPITVMETGEAGCVGAAILAEASLENGCNIAGLVKARTKVSGTYEPNMSRHDIYSERLEKYRFLYGALKPVL